MNWKIFSHDLSVQAYKPDSPAIPPLVGAALVGGGASLLGSLINSYSTSQANKANKAIADSTNEANLALYREQYKNAVEQWNRENAYNSSSSQLQRLRDAGLNPALNMGSNPTGIAEAASLPSANPMITGSPMQPPLVNFSDIGNNIAALTMGLKNTAEAQGQQLTNQFINQEKIVGIAKAVAEINERLSNAKKGSAEYSYLMAQKEFLMQEFKFNSETFDVRKQSFVLDNQVKEAQSNVLREQANNFAADTAYHKSLTALNWVEHSYRGQKLRSEIDNIINQAALSKSTAHLTDNQALTERFRARGLNITNSQAEVIFPYVKEQAHQAVKANTVSIMQQERDYSNPFNYFGRILGGTGSAAIKTFAK